MKKRELCILISSILVTGADAVAEETKRCPGHLVGAMGEGWTLQAAYNDALTAACSACAEVYGESCGPVVKERYDDGWFWNYAYLTVQCEYPCPPVTCDDEYDDCS